MQQIELGPVTCAPGVGLVFPGSLCANCGTREGVKVVDQDTRKTSYFVLGGTELTFQFPVATCESCAKSLSRRPKNIISNALISMAAGFLGFALLLLIIELGNLEFGFISGNLVNLGGVIAAAVFVALPLLQRPAPGQSSWFQPVRLVGLKRRFVDGQIEGFKFRFTNSEYQQAFSRLNGDAISNGTVVIKS